MAKSVYNPSFEAMQRSLYELHPTELRQMRQKMVDGSELAPEPIAHTRDIIVPGGDSPIPARVYTPENDSLGVPRPILLWLHGGGMVLGEGYVQSDRPIRRIANRVGCVVVAVDFRLAPEHPFPAGVRDCQAAMRWVAANGSEVGGDTGRIAIEGDSGGGLPAVVCAVTARDEEIALRHQLLIYPNLDCTLTESTWETHGTHGFDRRVMAWFLNHYLPEGTDRRDPLVSPAFTPDLTGLAPCSIITAGLDPLIGEARTYARRLQAAGVPVDLREWPTMPHGFFVMSAVHPEGIDATDYAAQRLLEAFGG